MKINREILRLTIPNIISNITVPLLGMVDLALMGHLDSTDYVGAIALGSMIFNFIYWSFSFLRMGTSGFTAQAFGENDFEKSGTIFLRAMLVALSIGGLLIILQNPIDYISFKLINGKESVEALGSGYFKVRIWAAPATLGLYVIYGWYIGMQNAKVPMFLAIIINVFNIILSGFFVLFMDMNAVGVALGTALAQFVGLILGLFMIFKQYRSALFRLINKRLFELKAMGRFFVVNRDIFLRTLLLLMVFTFFTATSAKSDTGDDSSVILNINTMLLQFFTIFSFFADGLAYAAEALAGKYIGAKDGKNLTLVIRTIFKWGFVIALFFSVLYLFAGNSLLSLFTNDDYLIKEASVYVLWISVIPLASFGAFVWDGIFIGATESGFMRNSMIISTLLVFFPLFFILKPYWGNHALWLALIAFLFVRGLSLGVFWRRTEYWKLKS